MRMQACGGTGFINDACRDRRGRPPACPSSISMSGLTLTPANPPAAPIERLTQARRTMDAAGVTERWRGRDAFTVIDTGFGAGAQFLATWQAWRDDPLRPQRLQYVAIEPQPCDVDGLAQCHAAWPEIAALSAMLRAAWP